MFAFAPAHSRPSSISARTWSTAFKGFGRAGALAFTTNSLLQTTGPTRTLPSYFGHPQQQATLVSKVFPKLTLWSSLHGLSMGSVSCKADTSDQSRPTSEVPTATQQPNPSTDSSTESTSQNSTQNLSTSSQSVENKNGTAPDVTEGSSANNGSQSSQLVFKAAAAMIPHPEKAYRGGEDAYFIGDDGLSLGVADGVGGWAEVNVDPGIYSRLLMKNCKAAAKELPASSSRVKDILIKAHGQTDQKGSSTACIITLEGTQLKAANIGDSGFLVMRQDKIVMRSPAQQHQFNFPYQIGGPDCGSDPPQSAEEFAFDLERGDVVVLATDGVTDNVFPEEAAAIVSVIQKRGESSQTAATGLANYASMRAGSLTHMTPFAVGAQQSGFMFQGGKLDDITVVVAYVADATSL